MGNCFSSTPSLADKVADTTIRSGRNDYVTDPGQDSLPPPPNREAPPTPPFPNPTAKVVVGLYSYTARTDEDLSFNKGKHILQTHTHTHTHPK